MQHIRKQELKLYAIIWAVVFAMVPAIMYFHVITGRDMVFLWKEVFAFWVGILPFLALFLVHEFLLTPLLPKRKVMYGVLATALLVLFAIYCFSSGIRPPGVERQPPFHPGGGPGEFPPPPHGRGAPPDGMRPVEPEVMRLIIGILMVVVNLGIKSFFHTLEGERKMQRLEAERLQSQLETLRYQVSPHFFMNTLNNIHALVDIDPARAKESIVEFSHMMRYVLYDGGSPTIPLDEELDFLERYLSLMRLRFTDSVSIEFSRPESCPGAKIPSLLYATFVENAFKHGVSYDKASFIRISVKVENGQIIFRCTNSNHGSGEEKDGGIGLANVRERLQLLYGDHYLLHIEDLPDQYDVFLSIPA